MNREIGGQFPRVALVSEIMLRRRLSSKELDGTYLDSGDGFISPSAVMATPHITLFGLKSFTQGHFIRKIEKAEKYSSNGRRN